MKTKLRNHNTFRLFIVALMLLTLGVTTFKVEAQKNVLLGVLPTVDVVTFRGDIPYVSDGISFDTITDKNDYQNIKRWVANVNPPINIDFTFPSDTLYSSDIYTGWYEGYDAGSANGGAVSDFSLQTFDGFDWVNVPGASIKGNTNLLVHFVFTAPIFTDHIRLNITKGDAASVYTRVSEVMIWDAPQLTALKSTNADKLFTTYPNPVSDVLNINLLNPKKDTFVDLLNISGQVISTHSTKGSNSISIDMSHLSGGVYFCRYNNGLQLTTLKVVKE